MCWRTISPPGCWALVLTALIASFMSGMAGNVTAFNTVFTYDIYQSYIRPRDSDDALPAGRAVWPPYWGSRQRRGAYVAATFNNIMDLLQLVFAFVNAPLFATFLLGMFWKRTTGHGAFAVCSRDRRCRRAPWTDRAEGPRRCSRAAGSGPCCTTTRAKWRRTSGPPSGPGHLLRPDHRVSLVTRRNRTDEELKGLVYSLTPRVAGRSGHTLVAAADCFRLRHPGAGARAESSHSADERQTD